MVVGGEPLSTGAWRQTGMVLASVPRRLGVRPTAGSRGLRGVSQCLDYVLSVVASRTRTVACAAEAVRAEIGSVEDKGWEKRALRLGAQ